MPSRLGGRAPIRPSPALCGPVWWKRSPSLPSLLSPCLPWVGGAHGPVTCSDTEPQGSLVRVTFLVRGTAGVKPVHDSPAA